MTDKTTQDSAAVVCCTYRNPEKPSLTRLYGIMTLIDQVNHQTFEGDKKIIIVDDSAEPHPFIQGLGDAMGEQLTYLHVPNRNNLGTAMTEKYPYAATFFPKDEDFETNDFWRGQLAQAKAWQNFLPFDYEFAKTYKMDLCKEMLCSRPSLGMKRNFGSASYLDAHGEVPDVFIYADDDDLHSPDYLKIVHQGIQGYNFARVTQTLCHNISPETEHRFWGEIDFKIEKDTNENWCIPADVMDGVTFKYTNGNMIERPIHDLYPRNLMLAWPLISHDGALHNYSGETWKNAAEQFGGFYNSTFSDDIIGYRNMSQLKDFKAAKIEVTEPPFIRCSDGRNTSDFYFTKVLETQEVPLWATEALDPLYRAIDINVDYNEHEQIMFNLGQEYAKTGKVDTSLIRPKNAVNALNL